MENNNNDIKYLKNIYQKCRWYSALHLNTYQYYCKIYNTMHFPMIIINCITAIVLNASNENEHNIINILSAVVLISNSCINSVSKFYKFDEKIGYHKHISVQYLELANNIEEYLICGCDTELPINKLYKSYLSLTLDKEHIIPSIIIKNGFTKVDLMFVEEATELFEHIQKENNFFGEKPSEIIKMKEKVLLSKKTNREKTKITYDVPTISEKVDSSQSLRGGSPHSSIKTPDTIKTPDSDTILKQLSESGGLEKTIG